jgi:putative hemolysin
MTYRKDVILINAHAKKEEVREIVNDEMHSTYPVYEEETDNLIGVVQLKDLFRHIDDPNFKIINHIKTPQYIAEQLSAYETLTHFKTSGVHFGIVIDEFGQMQGIVTMNDLLEALVGDPSEFHADEYTFTHREDGSWLVDGQYPLADFLRRFEMEEMISEFPFNTISGLILHELRSLPKEGQKLDWMNFSIEVVDMDMARIDKVLVRSKID